MGKSSDLTKEKIHEVKALIDTKMFSNREISRRLNISEYSVRRIKGKIEKNEDLGPQRKNKCGRKSVFSPRADRLLKKICVENRFASTNEIKTELNQSNVPASHRTVRRKLLQLNLKACRPARKPKLTTAMKAKRLLWAKKHQNKDLDFWKTVCFSDESIFEILANKAQYVRRRPGERFNTDCVTPTVKHPTKVMIWSVISAKGTGRLYIVKGTMKQDQYCKPQSRLIS